MKLQHLLLISGLSIINVFCTSTKTVQGHYVSNFPVDGFFITEVKLRYDSTFFWMKYGDLLADSASGKYIKDGNTILLFFNPTIIIPDSFQLSYLKEHNLPLSTLEPIKLPRPKSFKLKYKKLLVVDENGKIEKTAWSLKAGKKQKYYLILK